MDIQEQNEQIKRFTYADAQTGEMAQIAYRTGSPTVNLMYQGIYGTAALDIPVAAIDVPPALFAAMKAFLEAEGVIIGVSEPVNDDNTEEKEQGDGAMGEDHLPGD